MYRYSTFRCTKKSSSKPIDMEFSFEDLGVTSSKVKTVRNLDNRFLRYFILKHRFKKIKGKRLPSHRVQINRKRSTKYVDSGSTSTFKPGVQVRSNRMYKYSTFGCTKKNCQNLSTWDLVLKISTWEIQKWKRFVIWTSGSQDISF